MLFNFNYSNDFGEKSNVCCRCGESTRERCVLECPGVKTIVWACPICRYFISSCLSIFGEWFLRSVFAARDAQEAGEAVAAYSNAFNFDWNGRPPTKNRTKKRSENVFNSQHR